MTDGDKSYLAYMAARILEMRRVLAPTGSLYLHCDPTMSHYLKLVLDAIFGRRNFRNEIIWHYDGPQRTSRKDFSRKHDTILRYSLGEKYTAQRSGLKSKRVLSEAELKKCRRTEDGRYFYDLPKGDYTDESIRRLEGEGRIYRTATGNPRVMFFLDRDDAGNVVREKQLHDVWGDVFSLGHVGGNEKVGYPTQKPLALLERIVAASVPPAGVVLDPFCGCATACIAAERLHRQWVGIDISPKAADLVRQRMRDELRLFYHGAHRTDVPSRTDLGRLPRYNCAENTHPARSVSV